MAADDLVVHHVPDVPKEFRPLRDSPECSDEDDVVTVTFMGESFMYVIPSFDVIAVELRHMEIKGNSRRDHVERCYDLFIRNSSSLRREYPSLMIIKDVTVIKESEFNISMNTSAMHLPPQGVMVVWEWEWYSESDPEIDCVSDPEIDHVSETSSEDLAALNPDIESCDSDVGSPEDTSTMHTITFKCIGATHDMNAQEVLQKVSGLLGKGEEVQVNIFPEADNPYDNRAIAFKCLVDEEWQRIGYIVKEALNSVHSALASRKIAKVTFAWVKYLVKWTRSGPGYFAGVNITVYGQWPKEICQCASTR